MRTKAKQWNSNDIRYCLSEKKERATERRIPCDIEGCRVLNKFTVPRIVHLHTVTCETVSVLFIYCANCTTWSVVMINCGCVSDITVSRTCVFRNYNTINSNWKCCFCNTKWMQISLIAFATKFSATIFRFFQKENETSNEWRLFFIWNFTNAHTHRERHSPTDALFRA